MFFAVCDDKKEERKTIAAHISDYCSAEKLNCDILEYERREDLLESMLKQKYDIVFVCLNGFEGMEAAVKVRELDKRCDLVWISDSPDFALQSYRIDAAHFMVKPVLNESISEAIKRCGNIHNDKKHVGWITRLFK